MERYCSTGQCPQRAVAPTEEEEEEEEEEINFSIYKISNISTCS
jgi:predicted transcriptional regulator